MCQISITATDPAGVTAAEITIRATCGNCRHWAACRKAYPPGTPLRLCRYWELQHAHYFNLRDSLDEALFQAENKIQAQNKTKDKDNA